jgi:hypothetical protein
MLQFLFCFFCFFVLVKLYTTDSELSTLPFENKMIGRPSKEVLVQRLATLRFLLSLFAGAICILRAA